MERKFPIYITVDDVADAVVYDFINKKVQSGTLIPFVNSLLRGYLLSPEVRQSQDSFLSVMGDLDSLDADLQSIQRDNAMQGTLSGMLQDFTENQAQGLGIVPPVSQPVSPAAQAPVDTQSFLQGLVNSAVQSCLQGMVMQCLAQSAGAGLVQQPVVQPQPVAIPAPVQAPAPAPTPVPTSNPTPVQAGTVPVVAPSFAPVVEEPVVSEKVPVAEKPATPAPAKPLGGTPASFNKLLGSM